MAEVRGATVGILVRIGTGEPVEVAAVEVPLRIRLARDQFLDSDGRLEATAYVQADWEGLNDDVRAALHRVADELPTFEAAAQEEDDRG